MTRLARSCVRRRRAVVAFWLVALVLIAGGLGATAGDPAQDYATPGAESTRATDLVDRHMAGQANEGITVVWKDDRGADAAAVRERIDPFLQRAAPGSSWAASRSPTPRRAAAPRPRA